MSAIGAVGYELSRGVISIGGGFGFVEVSTC